MTQREAKRAVGVLLVVTALATGCTAPSPVAPASAPLSASAPEVAVAAPATSPAPAPSLAQTRAQAQRLAIEAVEQLQTGDETAARATLDRALALDAGNELAHKLVDQINADAENELGPVFFRYTVHRDESLSRIAQQFLGDRFRFYVLAKYNGIANPSRLAAGQVIRIPGKAPPATTVPGAAGARAQAEAEAAPAVEAAPPRGAPQQGGAGLIAKGVELERVGDLEGAYHAFAEAALRDPGNRDVVMQRDGARQAMIRRYDREAAQAFQRQNLDLAIARWDRILELEPANRKAQLERERALDLKKKMSEKFGAK